MVLLGTPYARPGFSDRLSGLRTRPDLATVNPGEGLELGQEIGAHAFTSRRMPEARVEAYSLASDRAKSKV